MKEAMDFQEKWGKLTDAQVAGVGNLNDSIGRISVIIEGVTNKVAAELAPAFQIVTDSILDGAKNVDGIDFAIRNAVTTATILAGTFMDGYEVLDEIAKRWTALHTGDFKGLTKPLEDSVLSLDKARGAYFELEKNREQARLDGIEAAAKREAENKARDLEQTKAQEKERLDGIKKAADEEKKLREQADRERRQMADKALKAAEDAFEKEVDRQRKLREDIAKGPGSGMEEGSAESVRFLAQQANQAIADSVVQDPKKQTDEQLLSAAKQQLDFMQKDAATKDKKLDKLVETMAENGWEAI